ncbi:MAG: GFA family protein [Deltaproteobacteria bacterium]|jgi:hypothetical protein
MEGHCTCRQIRYRLEGDPLFVHCCHCSWCQRETGTAFALNAMYEATRVEVLEGEPELVDTPSNSGKGQVIARCPTCRVALWSNYGGRGDVVRFVRVGTIDGHALKPDVHIFTSTMQPWLTLGDGAPVCDAYYDRKKLWPEASLEHPAVAAASPRPLGTSSASPLPGGRLLGRWKVMLESR